MKRNLLEPHVFKRTGNTIVIDEKLSKLIVGQYVFMTYVINDKKIIVKGFDVTPGNKILDVMIRVNKKFTTNAFSSITKFFLTRDDLKIQQTTGFCLPPEKPERESVTGDDPVKRDDSCLWESLVEVPPGIDVENLRREIMQINIEYEEKVISSTTITEVPIE